MSPPTTTVIPPRRRRKTRLACISCRIRKTGCDGKRPACAMCVARGHPDQCVYQADARTSVSTNQTQHSTVFQPEMVNAPSSSTRSISLYPPAQMSFTFSHTAFSKTKSSDLAPSDDETAVFGPSSNLAFIQQIAAAVALPSNEDTTQPSGSLRVEEHLIPDSVGFLVVDDSAFSQDFDTISLPERALSDMLLQAYWRHIHPIMPILRQSSAVKDYTELWQSSPFNPQLRRKHILFHAILNMMFALGCQRCDGIPPEQRKKYASSFYKRSLRLVSVETFDVYTLEIVQLLLLRSIYLQYAPHSVRCWTTCGVAIRAAQGLALHLDKPEENQLKREIKRRLWYGVLILERFAATSFGWPISTSSQNVVPFPKEIDEEYLLESGEGQQPDEIPSRTSFFIQYAKLTVTICTEVLERVYRYADEKPRADCQVTYYHYLRDVPDMCSRLDDFLENLPRHLKCQNSSSGNGELDECFNMQSEILRQRTLYIRLLVLRPCLLTSVKVYMRKVEAAASQNSVALLLQGSAMRDLSLLSVSTAHLVLNELHLTKEPPTWHIIRMTFGAVIVLLAASLIPELQVDFERGPAKLSWNKALDIFEQYKTQDPAVDNGVKVLWKYYNQFKKVGNRESSANVDDATVTDLHKTPSLESMMPIFDENWLANMEKEFEKDFPMGEIQPELFDSSMTEWPI